MPFKPIRPLPLGVPNAKYSAFDTPNTKNQSSSNIPNLKNFDTLLQYHLKYEMIRIEMLKFLIFVYSTSLSLFSQASLPLRWSFQSDISASFPLCQSCSFTLSASHCRRRLISPPISPLISPLNLSSITSLVSLVPRSISVSTSLLVSLNDSSPSCC